MFLHIGLHIGLMEQRHTALNIKK